MLPLGGAAFLMFGFSLVLLGVCQPGIAQSLALDHTRFGLLGSALSAGIGTSVLASGWLVDRYPRRPIFVGSALLAGAALASVDDGMGFGRALAHVALLGAGCGVYDTLLNTVTVERWGENAVRPMSLLHAAVPLGAVVAPWLVHAAGGSGEWIAVSRAAGACYFALAAWVAFVPLPPPSARVFFTAPAVTELYTSAAFLALCAV
ncbi:MAG: MFS transporter, partial [Myxococcales bacterium]|nr:MFS transporter [Myxococcales bacterium]